MLILKDFVKNYSLKNWPSEWKWITEKINDPIYLGDSKVTI